MGIITWQNISAPDFSAGQYGLRTASDLLNKAVESGLGTVKELAAIDAAKKASDQAMTERLLTQEMLQPQTSADYQKLLDRGVTRLGDGSQIPAELISPEMRKAFDTRKQTLLGREDEAAKRSFDIYTRGRTQSENFANDILGPIVARHAPEAVRGTAGREKALKGFRDEIQALKQQGVNIPIKSLVDAEESLQKMTHWDDPAYARLGWEKHLEDIERQAAEVKNRLDLAGANNPEAQYAILNSVKDPLVREKAIRMEDQDAKGKYSQDFRSPGAGYGIKSAPDEVARVPGATWVQRQFGDQKAKLAEMRSQLPETGQILAAAAENYKGDPNDQQKVLENTVARMRAEATSKGKGGGKPVEPWDIQDAIKRVHEASKDADGHYGISMAAAAEGYLSRLEGDEWYSAWDGVDGADVKGYFENDTLDKIGRNLAEYAKVGFDDYRRRSANVAGASPLVDQYNTLAQQVADLGKVGKFHKERATDLPQKKARMDALRQTLVTKYGFDPLSPDFRTPTENLSPEDKSVRVNRLLGAAVDNVTVPLSEQAPAQMHAFEQDLYDARIRDAQERLRRDPNDQEARRILQILENLTTDTSGSAED